ncbi:sodium:alanine symporter family protein [Clostridium aestuarii]|uniref:Sodium:alanine symporter family protein n=1 Tax=Clostridium aestuarii TaxID=338193 RepID=A0ABT4CVH4_9CLOT|nr:sodium:alanine symporter family protein [Clostridium aestuarii]MCY6482989.1 sodium:alanine symporter family protein [Clostridium aestuarii]
MDLIVKISDYLWGSVIGYLLLGTGLYYSLRLGVPQLKYFKHAMGVMKRSVKGKDGGVSGFGTLCAAVGSQVGTGSLVGVASALVAGGPGAVFWMWVTAVFGMVITFAEVVLGQLFREKQEDGTYRGGAAYYIEKGLKSKPLAITMALLYVFGIGIFIASLQTNSIANAFSGVVDVNPIIPGIVVIALTGLVIVGGVKRLADVSSRIVPFMALAYTAVVLYIIIININALPSVFALIIKSAFKPQAALGGVVGHTVMQAFRNGTARGLFSNDAGNGTAGTMHASADVKHPVEQALLAMMGTFITTIIICSCTAFAIILTGVLSTDKVGIHLLQESFGVAMGPLGKWIVFGAMFMFGFTTLLADLFYGETNIRYIFKEKSKTPIWIYRIVTAIILGISCVAPLAVIWGLIDIIVALIVFVNLIALFKLFKYVHYTFNDYVNQLKQGKEEPEWDKNTDITKLDVTIES